MHTGARLAGYQDARLEDRKLRQLGLAVLASLLLHALLLLGLSTLKQALQARATPPPLTARLKPKPPDPPPPRVEPVAPVPLPMPPRAAPVPKARPQASPQPAPAPAPVQSAPPPILAVEASKQAEPAFVVPAAPAPPVASTAGQPGTAPAASPVTGPDPGSIARFRIELMEIAGRYKRYPRIAQDNNWEGRVDLRIAFSESGAISSIGVRKGTGRMVLDEEAQAMIRRAQSQVVIPLSLRGKAFTLEIPVDFFLKEEK